MFTFLKKLNLIQLSLLSIVCLFIYLGMAKLMYNFVSDMSTMTTNVSLMGKAVNSLSRDVGSMSNDLHEMSSVLKKGQTKMSNDFKQISIDLHTMAVKAKVFEQDIKSITKDNQFIHHKVLGMQNKTSSIMKQTTIMNTSLHRVNGDVYKMARPIHLIPGHQ